jgi:jasmonate ZIM domain-containing protein
VVALDACTPARAAELTWYAAAASQGAPQLAPAVTSLVDIPIARKASLQRFLSKRKDRPFTSVEDPTYGRRQEGVVPPPAKKGKTEASSWLALGNLGDMRAQRSIASTCMTT